MSQDYKNDFTGDNLNQLLGVLGTLGKALDALKTDFSGPVEPTPAQGREAYSKWLDTSVPGNIQLKIRNTADDDWAVVWNWDGTANAPQPAGDTGLLFAIIFGS